MKDFSPEIAAALFERNPRPCMIFENGTLVIVEVNDAMCERYGWTREEFRSLTLRDIRPPEDLPRLEYLIDERRRYGGEYRRLSRHRTKSGEVFDVEVELTRLGGALSLVVASDLSATSEAERRYRLLVEMSSDGLAIVGEDRRMKYISPGGERILGVASDQIVGTDAMVRNHPDDLHKLVYNPPGETATYVVRVRHGDGGYRWIETTAKNLTRDPSCAVTSPRSATSPSASRRTRRCSAPRPTSGWCSSGRRR